MAFEGPVGDVEAADRQMQQCLPGVPRRFGRRGGRDMGWQPMRAPAALHGRPAKNRPTHSTRRPKIHSGATVVDDREDG
jgi:hypothetical protein